ncbi:MAG: DNA starvation/stationary phase protection protein [Rhodospirillales bacterium]|nr:DNA starvation/stationary phase protection protein [Alphaproteobacteria bacterium]MCB9986650.1 DNA starvation/stationary phase protection protein [Rhodospirillales bacterium]USO06822.1 MAG: DNA starvation/stationary phase protection protein [Rhodospirillales bacterium]
MKQIDAKKRKAIVEGLTGVLADTFVVYYKTHASHWNVEGEDFHQFHTMFEAQYTALWQALDEIAERIRALDAYAPVSVKTLMQSAALKETGQGRDAMQMIKDLASDHEDISVSIAKVINLAEDANDAATADMLTTRLGEHEKTAWMLRATAK